MPKKGFSSRKSRQTSTADPLLPASTVPRHHARIISAANEIHVSPRAYMQWDAAKALLSEYSRLTTRLMTRRPHRTWFQAVTRTRKATAPQLDDQEKLTTDPILSDETTLRTPATETTPSFNVPPLQINDIKAGTIFV